MEEIPQNLNQNERSPISETDFLARLNHVTEEDIQMLRANVSPENDMEKINQRKDLAILALLFKTPEEEIRDLIRISHKKGFLVGIHKIGSRLFTLFTITEDEKWLNLWKEVKNEDKINETEE